MTATDVSAPGARFAAPDSPGTGRRRRVGGWVALAVVLLVVGTVGGLLAGIAEWSQRDALDPDSAGPSGTRALAEILRDQGIAVDVVRDRADAAEALAAQGGATLVLPDTPALSDEALQTLAADADDVVLVDPRSRSLRLFLPDSAVAGRADVSADPVCTVPDAERAGPVTPGAVFTPGGGITGCYPAADGFGLLIADAGDRRVAALDARALLVNETLAEEGNAALGVNLLGRLPLVVWYVPGPGDTDLQSGDPTLGELTPPWVSPVIALLLLAALAAAIWRGRRFGPLVQERLPVTVRAAETAEGRARLYAQSRDAAHAADDLRIAALRRMARLLALGPGASADEISDAVADRLAADRRLVRGILIDDVPTTDAQLTDVAGRLRDLEGALHATLRPERNRP
jgi:hypothetical protein